MIGASSKKAVLRKTERAATVYPTYQHAWGWSEEEDAGDWLANTAASAFRTVERPGGMETVWHWTGAVRPRALGSGESRSYWLPDATQHRLSCGGVAEPGWTKTFVIRLYADKFVQQAAPGKAGLRWYEEPTSGFGTVAGVMSAASVIGLSLESQVVLWSNVKRLPPALRAEHPVTPALEAPPAIPKPPAWLADYDRLAARDRAHRRLAVARMRDAIDADGDDEE